MDPKAIYANVFYCRRVPRELRSLRTANEACLRIRYRRRRGKGGLDERNNRDMPTCFFYRFRKIRIGISYKRYRSISIRRFIHSFKDNAFIITMKFLILAQGTERERERERERDMQKRCLNSHHPSTYIPAFFAISRERSFRGMHLTGRL